MSLLTGCGPCAPDNDGIQGMKAKAYTASLNAGIMNFKNMAQSLSVIEGDGLSPSRATDITLKELNAGLPTNSNPGTNNPRLTYAKLYPTAPLQIVLIPIDSRGVIRIEGYAEDLEVPLVVEEYELNP